MRRYSALTAILVGGLIAGAIDITYAIVFSGFNGVPATRILQSVASGLLGSAAFEGGTPVAVLGFILHFVLMLLIAAIFWFASRRLAFLTRHAVTWGAIYGFLTYWVMNLVVLPLSAFPGKFRLDWELTTTSLIVHAFGIGVPIALAARRADALAARKANALAAG